MVKKRENITHQKRDPIVTHSKKPHRITVQGTQGGIVCHCEDCKDLQSFDFPSQVNEWKSKHGH